MKYNAEHCKQYFQKLFPDTLEIHAKSLVQPFRKSPLILCSN